MATLIPQRNIKSVTIQKGCFEKDIFLLSILFGWLITFIKVYKNQHLQCCIKIVFPFSVKINIFSSVKFQSRICKQLPNANKKKIYKINALSLSSYKCLTHNLNDFEKKNDALKFYF